jgi:hypothetical protein
MSSVASAGLAQIPRNSHFRAVPSLCANNVTGLLSQSIYTFTPTSGVAAVLTNLTGAATGGFSVAPWLSTASGTAGTPSATSSPYVLMSQGLGLLKDMGDTIVSAGRTFRRVQFLNPNTVTDQQGGTYVGVDSDANSGYIEVGFRGAFASGPFVRGF